MEEEVQDVDVGGRGRGDIDDFGPGHPVAGDKMGWGRWEVELLASGPSSSGSEGYCIRLGRPTGHELRN